MTFKKGDKFEVFSEEDMSVGAWRTAEIISCNRDDYTVRSMRCNGGAAAAVVETVPRNVVRPCPPLLEVAHSWVYGDIVEVFVDLSWKIAVVERVLANTSYLVRLIGSSYGFKVRKYDIRVRQSWLEGKWIVIGQATCNVADEPRKRSLSSKNFSNSRSQIQLSNTNMNLHRENRHVGIKDSFRLQKLHNVSTKILKRRLPYCDSEDALTAGTIKKLQTMDKDDKMCTATDLGRHKVNENAGCPLAVNSDSKDAQSLTSSVGSCSINASTPYTRHCFTGAVRDIDSYVSDAESFCQTRIERGNSRKEESVAQIHSLELHAYRCTIEALHASGPLSWERETMVTNLRLSLNISNDEHLMEIRNLISGNSRIRSS